MPTLAEAGLGDFDLLPWNSWFAPKGTPPEIVDKLNAAIADILADAEVRKRLSVPGYETGTKMNQAEAAASVETEARKWAELIRASGITGE